MSSTPIADHALLSDCHAAALVDRDGDVVWWCGDRFDSPSVFGRLLDDGAGGFRIGPVEDPITVRRHYRPGTLVLVTEFRTDTGVVELTEALAMAEGTRGHSLGEDSPHVLLRTVACTEGRVEVATEFTPRLEYGLTTPRLEPIEGGVVARGGATALIFSTDREVAIQDRTATQRFDLSEGERASFSVHHRPGWEPLPEPWPEAQIVERIEDTVAAWVSWGAEHQRYEGEYADLVAHSGRVLQGLTYRPTGAMVAAPTTSLPETVGGGRNWDYRYSWIRDASFTLDALWVAACPDESRSFVEYLTVAASSLEPAAELQIMFGITGERDLTERELPWLDGWRQSRPVRVGNGAWTQRQIDVYGELLDAVLRLRDQLVPFEPDQQAFLRNLADTAVALWEEPDNGMWEIRGEPDHHLGSKLMCWVAADRAISLADDIAADRDQLNRWDAARQQMRRTILERGWNAELESFTQTLDGADLDASALLIPIVGFLPGDHPKVRRTIEAMRDRLVDERGLVYRYRTEDGLTGQEGSFLLCTYWLAQALAEAGDIEAAAAVFERAAGYANDVGLLAEEIDTASGEQLGNFPQAFSHIGLINAAWAITTAQRSRQAKPDLDAGAAM